MSNNSDYSKPRMDLFEKLPEVYQSDTVKALMGNLFNRFLTKSETEKVAGYIGQGNPNAIVKRQIQEPTVHRQGYQLQPILYNKIGSVEWMSSWYDLLNEIERLGIDVERMQEWLNLLKFNWAPPIDIDKIIHYEDYYWYDEENVNSRPQYLTIRSRCATATALVSFQERLIDEFGALIPTVRAEAVDGFSGSPVQYDKLVIAGEYSRLLQTGFVFFYKNSSNIDLDSSFLEVVESEYDETADETTIKIDVTFTDSTVDGVVSLEEKLAILIADRDCKCLGAVGWDLLQWDDNPAAPLWSGDHTPFIAGISHAGPPEGSFVGSPIGSLIGSPSVGSPVELGELWYDTVADKLYQRESETTWKLIWSNFSTILADTQGLALWDYQEGCGVSSTIAAADQWIEQNKWLHKSDVPNFSIAKQASLPIIEYDWDLELNEWTYTAYSWKYRMDGFSPWVEVDETPPLIELIPLTEWTQDGEEIVLAEQYGDLTSYFTPGRTFFGEGVAVLFETAYSQYVSPVAGQPARTHIRMTVNLTGSGLDGSPHPALRPSKTLFDDFWTGYNTHWVNTSVSDPVAVGHQPDNPFTEISNGTVAQIHSSGQYQYTSTYYAQDTTILIGPDLVNSPTFDGVTVIELAESIGSPATGISPRRRALVGMEDTRVYVNGVRQYGTYDELTEADLGIGSPPDDTYVAGIEFLPGFEPNKFDIVRIEVGEASPLDFGYSAISVRTIEDDGVYATNGNELRSLIRYRKAEQVKTETNQYPLFDMYRVDNTPAYLATPLFGFLTDQDASVNAAVGLRLATGDTSTDYIFQQFLVEDDGTMYAYRDYNNQTNDYWVRPLSEEVYFWDGLTWSSNTTVGLYYASAIVSDAEPSVPWNTVDGVYWYDTLEQKLKQLAIGSPNVWTEVEVISSEGDPTLQTIWKKGLNDERYVPEKRDWQRRSLDEYNAEKDEFVEQRAQEYVIAGSTVTEAQTQAEADWATKESNHLSLSGEWVGDWEIPDPLYFNVSHENRQTVSLREVLTHFNTIIDEQPTIPGFNGPKSSMFHLLTPHEVNYGLGGKIREYNNAFDTFLSSLFITNVSPRSLFVFAHDQYEVLLNTLKELFRSELVDDMLVVSDSSLSDQSAFVVDRILTRYEQNDHASLVYGDSTTFTEVDGTNDLGLRNWIATLPYIHFLTRLAPAELVDKRIGVNQVVHHDGHRRNYTFTSAYVVAVTTQIINTLDERTRFPGPTDPPTDTMGRSSNSLPPNTVSEFATSFSTAINNRKGVYWNFLGATPAQLYRLNLIDIGTTEPSPLQADGSLWLDLGTVGGQLREKQTSSSGDVSWVAVTTVGRLHNGSDPSDVTTATVSAWQEVDLNELLLNIIFEAETRLYENAPTDLEPLRYDLAALQAQYPDLYEDKIEEAFLNFANEGGIVAPFANNEYTLANPFTWNYKHSIPTLFPSSLNTGNESGGDWRDLYEKLFGTPYPHLEPWKLQGYNGKPDWWDEAYQNDDIEKWGDRRWKYKHGFDITGVDTVDDYVVVKGDFREVFLNGRSINVEGPMGSRGDQTVRALSLITGVNTGAAGTASIVVDDDVTAILAPGTKIAVTGLQGTPGQYELTGLFTVTSSTFVADTTIGVEETITSSTGFDAVTGAVYDPDDNDLTIYFDSPVPAGTVAGSPLSDRVLLNGVTHRMLTSPILPAAYGMWENIRFGVIPAGELYPNGIRSVTGIWWIDQITVSETPTMPTYYYFGVNVGNGYVSSDGGTTKYYSDDVLPPFWDHQAFFGSPSGVRDLDTVIRSVFRDFSTEIVSPGAEYVYGDAGPIEWAWRSSSEFLYEQLAVAFQIDPIRLTQDTFGFDTYVIGGLEIDKRLEQVLSHSNTDFHGDIINNALLQVEGTNQWYVNYNREGGFDLSMSDFRSMWTQWTAPLMYQFASFIDTPSLEVGHRQVCVSQYDYQVTSKRSPGVDDFWMDSFEVSILYAPPSLARYNNEADWQFEIATRAPVGNTISYYDVEKYQFYADPDTDTCSLYTWSVLSSSSSNNTFTVSGNQVEVFERATELMITESSVGSPSGSPGSNDGTYTTVSAAYNVVNNTTIVEVEETVPLSVDAGVLSLTYRTLPWTTGDVVIVSTEETLPVPLQGDTSIGVTQYFVIVIDDTHFQLALTKQNALDGAYIDLTTQGRRNHYVARLATTFNTSRTTETWKHYVVDRTNVLTFTPPYDLNGIQHVVNVVDGYSEYTYDEGWRINEDKTQRDFDLPSRFADWQRELERFIDFSYNARIVQRKVNDKFEASVDVGTNIWTLVPPGDPQFITGDAVTVLSSNGVFPPPLAGNLRYYLIRDSLTTFRLAATRGDANAGVAIDVTSILGVDELYISAAKELTLNRPVFEINPFRNAIWFRPQFGIVSNLLSGPTIDLFDTQLFVDQYRRPIGVKNMRVFREDKLTTIRMADNVLNDVALSSVFPSPYNYLHLGSCHLFIDTYEHVLIFNNDTTEGQLLYDPFVGLNVTKYEMLFNRQPEFTQRPNVGGQYLSTLYNQGADLKRNFEASVEDLRFLYDTYQVQETNQLTEESRKVLGYEGRQTWFDQMNMNAKSQFAFWRGMIQAKGSLNVMKAFTSSRRFVDAQLDEFWAVKVGEFGSAFEKEYLEMWLTSQDARSNELRLTSGETPEATLIQGTDQERWKNQPDQLRKMRDQAGKLFFELKPVDRIDVTVGVPSGSPPVLQPGEDGDGWIWPIGDSPLSYVFYRWIDGQWEQHGNWANGGVLRHDFEADYVTITMDWNVGEVVIGSPCCSSVGSPPTATDIVLPMTYLPGTDSLNVFRDGVLQTAGIDYLEVDSGALLSNTIRLTTLIDSSIIKVVITTSNLKEGVHYEITNSNIVELNTELFQSGMNFRMWGWRYNKGALNPAKLIDTQAETVVTPVTVWDPARDMHYYNGIHTVQLQNSVDPAVYTDTPRTNQVPVSVDGLNLVYNDPWNNHEVGTTWLDTYNLAYQPYYDVARLPDIEDRLRLWGSLADWAELKIYAWVESDAPPSEWDAAAAVEEGDASIPENTRKSGRVKETLFELDGAGNWIVARDVIDQFDVVIDGVSVANDYQFVLKNNQSVDTTIVEATPSEGSPAFGTITISGSYEQLILPGMSVVVSDMVPPTDTYWFDTSLSALNTWNDMWAKIPEFGGSPFVTPHVLISEVDPVVGSPPVIGEGSPPGVIYAPVGSPTGTPSGSPGSPVGSPLVAPTPAPVVLNDVPDAGTHWYKPSTGQLFLWNLTTGDWDEQEVIVSVMDPTLAMVFTVASSTTAEEQTTIELEEQLSFASTVGTLTYYPEVDVYVNGISVASRSFVEIDLVGSPSLAVGSVTVSNLALADRIHVIHHPVPTFETSEETDTFVATEVEYGSLLQDVEYTTVSYLDRLGLEQTKYYFWVENKNTGSSDRLSPFDAQIALTTIPIPYMLFQNVQPEETVEYGGTQTVNRSEHQTTVGTETLLTTQLPIVSVTSVFVDETLIDVDYTVGGSTIAVAGSPTSMFPAGSVVINYVGSYAGTVDLPVRYEDVVVRGLRGLIDENRRFVLRWTRDFTLRDTLENGTSPLELKTLHEEWELIRPEQPSSIPRVLWDKITESMVGYLLTDSSVRVPSYERELYDERYGTATQYGLGKNQSFTNGSLAVQTILAYLNDPNVDFAPVDINVFFQNNSFDSNDEIVEAMDDIYNTFPYKHVNRMFFSVLQDAFSLKSKYEDIFKTSMVALYGIVPFEVGGVFDD